MLAGGGCLSLNDALYCWQSISPADPPCHASPISIRSVAPQHHRGTESCILMEYGHLHGVLLENRDGGAFVTFAYGPQLRETCELERRGGGKVVPVLLRTNVAATPAIVDAFNQGNASFLRADEQARTVRQAIFAFLQAAPATDGRWGIIADDLHRHATAILCIT